MGVGLDPLECSTNINSPILHILIAPSLSRHPTTSRAKKDEEKDSATFPPFLLHPLFIILSLNVV